jgi:hypothetical protein
MKEKGRLARLLTEGFAFGLVGYRLLKPKTGVQLRNSQASDDAVGAPCEAGVV